jgi:NAD(P)H-hydrate epimerase
MENAGLAAASVIRKTTGIENQRFAVVCGSGNNGGDGLVVARQILSMGGRAEVLFIGDPSKMKGASRTNLRILEKLDTDKRALSMTESPRPKALSTALERCDAVVDAVFGTGLARDVEGVYRKAIELINASDRTVFSLDIPSGVNGDNGQPMGCAVEADHTITFGLPKTGNLLFPGHKLGGTLHLSHIGFPPSLYERLRTEINSPPELPPRMVDGHKGSFGDVLFICGASNYFGAPYFSAFSFLKAGGGYSRLATPRSVTPVVASRGPEIVFHPQAETASGSLSLKCKGDLLELSERVDMVVIGPGLSLEEETQQLVRELALEIERPILIDGDGITAVSANPKDLTKRRKPTVLTPHMGEMARLTGRTVPYTNEHRLDELRRLTSELKAFVVLKGAHTLVGYPDGKICINLSGNSGMATAGSGDVLAGTIAAAFGLGLSLAEAVRTGVFLHGAAGDIAAETGGEDGVTAETILECLPQALLRYREDRTALIEGYGPSPA